MERRERTESVRSQRRPQERSSVCPGQWFTVDFLIPHLVDHFLPVQPKVHDDGVSLLLHVLLAAKY